VRRDDPARRRTGLAVLTAAVALLPLAATCAVVEIVLRRGGTIFVEARRL
jgi:hypothetical protein